MCDVHAVAAVQRLTTRCDALLVFGQVVFDMDGTLTQAHIDFADMRARTGAP
jgi:hypothetical protein